MLALLSRYIVRLVVLILLILGTTFNATIVLAEENSAQPAKSSETTETVVPSPKTESKSNDSKTEKDSSSKTTKQKSKVTYPNPPHRYNRKAIEKFDEELYGN